MSERDIVEDLREGAMVLDEWYHRESVAHTMLRAADEIERLRASTPEGSEDYPWREPGVSLTNAPAPPENQRCFRCGYVTADATNCPTCAAREHGKDDPAIAPPSHDVEALREALEEIASMGPVSMSMVLRAEDLLPKQRKRVSQMQGIARRALSQHVGGEG